MKYVVYSSCLLGMVALLVLAAGFRSPSGQEWFEEQYAHNALTHKVGYILPAGIGPWPAVVLVHGGGWQSGSLTQMRDLAGRLAEEGYAAFAVNYRLGSPDAPAGWGAVEDIQAAVDWVCARPDVDTSAVYLYGESAGAHLALLAAMIGGDVTGVVAVCPPTDLPALAEESDLMQAYVASFAAREGTARAASPIRYVTPETPPVCIIHGCGDNVIPVTYSDRFVRDLVRAGARVEYHRILGAWHVFVPLEPETYVPLMVSFMRRVADSH